jgi:predicted esterase
MTTPVFELPGHVRPGEPTRVTIPGYRAALVFHGKPGVTRAMIYLHGVCGNVQKIEDWTDMASNYVTTIALYGNKPCPTAPARASWNQDIEFIHQLIQTALNRVAEDRAGQLDVHRAVLFGYSQGASRAERLVERYPEHYPWLVLGGPPSPPRFERLRGARRSVILVGSEEHQEHLAGVAQELTTLGAPTEFNVFSGVGHGSFGRDAPRVMNETLSWLLELTVHKSPTSAAQ